MTPSWYSIRSDGPLDTSGIYQWHLNGVPIYTGKAINLARRLRQYDRNMRNIREGLPYRGGNPDGYRAVHRRLSEAVSSGTVPAFHVVENCDASQLNERERYHQRSMEAAAPLHDLQQRVAAERCIVAAILAGVVPAVDNVRNWLRGGAAFWNDDHLFVAWGLLLNRALSKEQIEDNGIRAAIEEADDNAREKFGSIPLRDSLGNESVAITAFNGFAGDRLFAFYRSVDEFVSGAPDHGWLLAQHRDMSDALEQLSDQQLEIIWSRRLDQPFR